LDPVGGRLQDFAAVWEGFGVSDWVQSRIAEGVRFRLSGERRFTGRLPFDSAKALGQAEVERMRALVLEMAAHRMIERCEPVHPGRPRSTFNYDLVFPRPKPHGNGDRPCYDAKRLNRSLPVEHFKMEGFVDALHQTKRGDFYVKADIEKAFPHLLLHESVRDLQRFVFDGVHYRFRALNFGLSLAPRTFCKVLQPVIDHLRRLGHRVVWYMDDLLGMGKTKQEARKLGELIVQTLREFGFLVSEHKCELEPVQRIEFLGLILDSGRLTITLPRRKLHMIRRDARRLLDKGEVSARQVAGLLGKTQAATHAITELRDELFSLESWKKFTVARFGWDRPQALSRQARGELVRLREFIGRWNGRSILNVSPDFAIRFASRSPKSMHVLADASPWGYGGHRVRDNGPDDVTWGGFSDKFKRRSHNSRELRGAIFVSKGFIRDELARCPKEQLPRADSPWIVDLECDNKTACSYLNAISVRVRHLHSDAKQFRRWLKKRHVVLRARYRPGVDMVKADALSRILYDASDWSLNSYAFHQTVQAFGAPSVDLFASHYNAKCPKFYSWHPDPEATGTNAFDQFWGDEELAFANPPVPLIHRLLDKVQRDQAEIVLVAPDSAKSWLPRLMEMAVEDPLVLTPLGDLAKPGMRSPKRWMPPPGRHLAWRLSGKRSE
jgi:Reverse transcriptase (RNA-dependent DNA polymerase)/DNA N-6-adenine-methyltransferase (Dam)